MFSIKALNRPTKLFALVKRLTSDEHALEASARMIFAETVARAPVDTGALRSSLRLRRVGKNVFRIETRLRYAVYVEYGTVDTAPSPFLRAGMRAKRRQARQRYQQALRRRVKS